MKVRYLVWLRRISQTLFLLFFLYLLVESRLPQVAYIDYSRVVSSATDLKIAPPVTFFFQLDPLIFLSSLLSGHYLMGPGPDTGHPLHGQNFLRIYMPLWYRSSSGKLV